MSKRKFKVSTTPAIRNFEKAISYHLTLKNFQASYNLPGEECEKITALYKKSVV
jgi:hypothetical protein